MHREYQGKDEALLELEKWKMNHSSIEYMNDI